MFIIGNLEVTPPQGEPGSSFTATARGLGDCGTVSFQWDGQVALGETSNTETSDASLKATVPDGYASGTYKVNASCKDGRADGTFTVIEKSSLALSPEQGGPGTRVKATASGLGACLGGSANTISWQWDGGPLQTSPAQTDGSIVTFEVPADASPTDGHTVTASCGAQSATAPFAVTAIAKPALTLDESQGLRGSKLTANGTGFDCGDDRVQILWDGKTPLGDGPSGTFAAQLTIPEDASISQHTVVATCQNHADVTDSQPFAVTKDTTGVEVEAAPASLAVEPSRGGAGLDVHVVGHRFACTESRIVELSWDDQPLATSTSEASGDLDTSISVPANAEAGSHLVRASCSAGSGIATAGFTVIVTGTRPETTPPPPPPPPPPWGIAGWVVLVIVAVLAVVAYRHWRKPRAQPTPRVYATVSSASGPPLVTTRETPARGEVTHALRLQVHADLGTESISEVESDHSTQ